MQQHHVPPPIHSTRRGIPRRGLCRARCARLGCVLIASFGLAGLLSGCDGADEAGPMAIRVVATGDTNGWIVPCGCASNQAGGLPRRGTLVEQLEAEVGPDRLLVVDAGGAPGGRSPYDRVKFEAILRGEILLGVAAHNIGAPEAALGPDYLRRTAEQLDFPFVSANTRDGDGRPLAPGYREVIRGGRRIAVIGVLSPSFAQGSLKVTSPEQAVLEILDRWRERPDFLIVLAYLPPEELRELAEALPEVDLVLGGPTGQPIAPTLVGPVVLAAATNQGKFAVDLELPPVGNSARPKFSSVHAPATRRVSLSSNAPAAAAEQARPGRVVELGERFADHPAQRENLIAYHQRLAREDFTPAETSFTTGNSVAAGWTGGEAMVAGVAACAECHPGDTRLWENSKHAHAWQSIAAKGAHVDPACQRCHTDGYGLPGGFLSRGATPARVNVGCESCHGPSGAHVENPTVHTPHYRQAKARCVICHDRENSPHFELEPYWAMIRHGDSDTPSGEEHHADEH